MKIFKLLFFFLPVLLLSCSGDDNADVVEPIIVTDDTANLEFFADGEVEVYFDNAGTSGITMIFIGDGYIQSDLEKTNGSYRRDAVDYFDFLFSIEPFASYQEHFNAVIIYTESNTRTILSEDEGTSNTALRVITNSNNHFRADSQRLNYYRTLLPNQYKDINNILVSVNGKARGNASLNSNLAYSGSLYKSVMVHEVGHSFAGLGDEYEGGNRPPADTSNRPNLDNTSDLEQIKWKHFLEVPDYIFVGAYEGGGYTSEGIWRPEPWSIMRNISSSISLKFNAPSREAIVQRIMESIGSPYSFESFLERDILETRAAQEHIIGSHDLKDSSIYCNSAM